MSIPLTTFASHLPTPRAHARFVLKDLPQDGAGIWIRGMRNTGHQKDQGHGEGFRSATLGLMVGLDRFIRENWLLGAGLGLSTTNVGDNQIKANQLSLYSTYTHKPWFVDGFFTYSYNRYHNLRAININSLNRVAESKFRGHHPALKVRGGRPYQFAFGTLTPTASLYYSYLRQNEYDEYGAEAANLIQVESKNIHKLEPGLGLQLNRLVKLNLQTYNVDVHAQALYDISGSEQITQATLQGAGGTFVVSGFKPAKFSLGVGFGISTILRDWLVLDFSYDHLRKNNFVGHNVSLKLKCLW